MMESMRKKRHGGNPCAHQLIKSGTNRKRGDGTKELAFQVLLHGVIIADEDVTSQHNVAGEDLGGRQGFEALVVVGRHLEL